MAWPSEAGSLPAPRGKQGKGRSRPKSRTSFVSAPPPPYAGALPAPRGKRKRSRPRRAPQSRIVGAPEVFRQKLYLDARGCYRVFNSAVYSFFRSNSAPPAETDSAYATSASLPATPADTFADGTWYISMDYSNGILSSGFRPQGNQGETYARLDISGGAGTTSPPQKPLDVELELVANGVVRILASYREDDSTLRGDTWAIAYTTDASTPATDTPDVTQAFIGTTGEERLSYDLPAQSNGTTVKVRVQIYRSGDTTYSDTDASDVLTETADAAGPTAPSGGETWTGYLPEDF